MSAEFDELQKLIDGAVKNFGRVDIMVNNAGVETRTSVLDTTEAQYDRVLSIDLKSALRFTLVAWLIGAAYFLMLVVPLISIGSALDNAMTVAWNIVYRIATEGLPEPPPWLSKLPVVGARLVRAWRSDAHNVAGLLVDEHSTLIVVARVASAGEGAEPRSGSVYRAIELARRSSATAAMSPSRWPRSQFRETCRRNLAADHGTAAADGHACSRRRKCGSASRRS